MSQIGSKRISEHFGTGIFAELNAKRDEMEKQGRKLYNLFVGTPDFAPAPHIMEAVQKSAANPEDYKYSLIDIPELLDAVVDYYGAFRCQHYTGYDNRSTWFTGRNRTCMHGFV